MVASLVAKLGSALIPNLAEFNALGIVNQVDTNLKSLDQVAIGTEVAPSWRKKAFFFGRRCSGRMTAADTIAMESLLIRNWVWTNDDPIDRDDFPLNSYYQYALEHLPKIESTDPPHPHAHKLPLVCLSILP